MSEFVRPQPEDDEDDILRQQEEYFKKGVTPSVSVNKRKCDQRNVSAFAKTSRKKKIHVHTAVSVLSEVKEKLPQCADWSFSGSNTGDGFPEVFVRDKTINVKDTSSIFSQHISVSNYPNEDVLKCSESPNTENKEIIEMLGSRSYIVSGNDSMEIHLENVKKLSEMSMDEIQAEQKKLKETLNPKILKFLSSRRKKNDQNVHSEMEVDEIESNSSSLSFGKKSVEQNTAHFSDVHHDSAKNWLHMNLVEEEKLHWVGDIPPAEPIGADQQYNARFDFQGMLMPYTINEVDVRQALYHHGEEPQRPGYSIEELYQLSRSTVLQQRVIALNTIGNILEKVRQGYYDICFNENLLSQFLDHDLFLLLRFALDENTEVQLVAALFAFKNFLCSDVDELCLDRAMGCRRSIWQPNLSGMHHALSSDKEMKETEAELKDYKMLKVDAIKGALRTDIILRIRYILEVLKPGSKAVISCLEILSRIARHSLESALAITCCPRLLKVIITNFLPKNWNIMVADGGLLDLQSVYNIPVAEALKLMRIIACHSHKLASDIVHKYSVMDSVICYLSIDPKECSLPIKDALHLILESFYIWQTFLAYNLAAHHFIDMHPVLMRLLQYHYNTTSMEKSTSSFSYEHGTALISLIEQAIHTAQFQHLSKHHASKTLTYRHVKDFGDLLEMCLSKWLVQLGNATDLTFFPSKLVGATFNCLTSLYSFHLAQSDSEPWLANLENFCELRILQYLRSEGLKKATASLQGCSCLLFAGELGSKRDPPSLPSLGALMWKGECLTPVLQPKSPIVLLSGLLNFLLVAYTAHKGLNSKYVEILLQDSSFMNYIKCVQEKASAKLASHWFTRLEVYLLVSFLKLASLKKLHFNVVHRLAFKLITLIQRDEKYLIQDIMSQIVFNADFFENSSAICEKMATLQIDSAQSNITSRERLILMSCQELPALWDCYKNCLNLSEDQMLNTHLATDTLTATTLGTDLFLPIDWSYLPIIHLYNNGDTVKKINAELLSSVTAALKWVFLVEELRPDVAVGINITDKFCRLSTVFLCGNDLFLDPVIHELLFASLRGLMLNYQKIKFPPSFYDMYTQLLEQFAAVSYGDSLFGQFVLIPLQQRHSPELRKQVWSEHAAVLRILSTPVDQLLFPVSELLEPCEMDESLLLTYLHCLATGAVQEHWCPVLYLTAMHHVATYIKLCNETDLAKLLALRISKLGNKALQSLLLNYGK